MFFLTHMPVPSFDPLRKDCGWFEGLRMGDREFGANSGSFNRELIPDNLWDAVVYGTGWYRG